MLTCGFYMYLHTCVHTHTHAHTQSQERRTQGIPLDFGLQWPMTAEWREADWPVATAMMSLAFLRPPPFPISAVSTHHLLNYLLTIFIFIDLFKKNNN